jgi:mono/diheme cytochrome c family protein
LGAVDGLDQGRSNFSGAVMADSGWYAPALNLMAEGGVAHWQPSEVVQWFKTGVNAHANATGSMAQVVLTSMQYWTDADLQALSVYLQDLRNLPGQTPPTARASSPANPVTLRGAQIYDKQCADCHGVKGEGARVEGADGISPSGPTVWAYPPLAGNRAVTQASSVNLVRLLRGGGFAPATAGNPRPYGMPPFDLADDDMAAVVSYIRSAWGNRAAPVTAVDVRVEK